MSKQLISSYFKPSLSKDSEFNAPSKRPRLSHLSSPSPANSTDTSTIITKERNQKCEISSTVVAHETSNILCSLSTNNFSRSLNFTTQVMELDETVVNIENEAPSVSKMKPKLTPLEHQVMKLQGDNPGVILAVQVGYKYLFFGDDAGVVSTVLRTFTYTKHTLLISPVPAFRIGITIRRLVRAGHKVGVVLQSESASMKAAGMTEGGKSGTFTRHLARTYTAASLVDDDIICDGEQELRDVEDEGEDEQTFEGFHVDKGGACISRWFACVLDSTVKGGLEVSVVFAELHEGRLVHHVFRGDEVKAGEMLIDVLHQIGPCEIIYASLSPTLRDSIHKFVSSQKQNVRVENVSSDMFQMDSARAALLQLKQSNNSISRGASDDTIPIDWGEVNEVPEITERCLGGLVGYLSCLGLQRALKGVHGGSNSCPVNIEPLQLSYSICALDDSTLRDLQVFERDGSEQGSLFDFMNRTVTAVGRRTLKNWLLKPLGSVETIRHRVAAVELLADLDKPQCVRRLSSAMHRFRGIDLDAICVQLASGRLGPSRLVKVVEATQVLVQALPTPLELQDIAQKSMFLSDALGRPQKRHMMSACEVISCLVDAAAKDDKVLALRNGFWEAPSDFLSTLMTQSLSESLFPLAEATRLVLDAESALRHELVVLSSSVGRHLNFRHLRVGALGALEYLVELPVTVQAPDGWVIVNSTQQCHRYRPSTIAVLHQKLLQCREQRSVAATYAWETVLQIIEEELYASWRCLSGVLGVFDAVSSLSLVSSLPGYTKPSFESKLGVPHTAMKVVGAKHPTMDWLAKGKESVANDIHLSRMGGPQNITIVTGPNMGGKSTYVRMVAVLSLLGQVGSYVPCDQADFLVFDQIRTRMGADDDIANGMSSFLVELDHCSRIIKRATPRSLVILDELGRGTSTHDGVAVAKATLLYLINHLKCATLFVTHYPEISELALTEPRDDKADGQKPPVVNLHMDYMLLEEDRRGVPDVVFLYRAVSGKAGTSHGLSVAQLAGLPSHLLAIAVDHHKSPKPNLKQECCVGSVGSGAPEITTGNIHPSFLQCISHSLLPCGPSLASKRHQFELLLQTQNQAISQML